MSDLDKFLEEREKIQIPDGDVARVRLLAKELARGVYKKLWKGTFFVNRGEYISRTELLYKYFEQRWEATDDVSHYLELLQGHGYIEKLNNSSYQLSNAAFELLREPEPYNIFISYKHSESSAFALLVLARLKQHGLVPFVDMALEAGGNWHAELEDRIKKCDYFIILLGKETLTSEMTVKEIKWAIEYKKTIIPVWHSEFDPSLDKWKNIDCKVKSAIKRTNAIRVLEESASRYNSAIVKLLNRFGVTP